MFSANVIIIGCGSIGAMKNDKYDSPNSDHALTWANAFYKLKNNHDLNLCFIDKDGTKAEKAADKWKGLAFDSLNIFNETYISNMPNIYIVATDTQAHKDVLKEVSKYHPTFVIAEKPFTDSLSSALEIQKLYNELKIPILINYLRRYLTLTSTIKFNIEKKIIGEVQACRILYTRGFKRDASHALDLASYFFGTCEVAQILDWGFPIYDYSHEDPSYSAFLSFEKCKNITITAVNGNIFDAFEIDIIGSTMRNILMDHGKTLDIYRTMPEPLYGDYNTLSTVKASYPTYLEDALTYGAMGVIDSIQNSTPYRSYWCSMEDAIKVHKIFEKLGI